MRNAWPASLTSRVKEGFEVTRVSKGPRLHELDSLRGLAALSVVACHCLKVRTGVGFGWLLWLLDHTPLGIVRAGHEAVILFFVLSGFVLAALPFLNGPVRYRAFLAKRVCRIYLPYYVALALAILMAQAVGGARVPGVGSWFNIAWTSPLTPKLLLQHVALLPSFPNATLNPAIWSLVHEMRVSLLFPVLLLLVRRFSWWKSLALGGLTSFVGYGTWIALREFLHINWDYTLTGHCLAFFIIGILLARHRSALVERMRACSARRKWLLLGIAVLCYTPAFWLDANLHVRGLEWPMDWLTAGGSALFIVIALSSTRASWVLSTRPLLFLGRTSYSIYLLHATVLLSLVRIWYAALPTWALWGMTFACVLPLSWLSYRLTERPSIQLGRMLSGWMGPGLAEVSAGEGAVAASGRGAR